MTFTGLIGSGDSRLGNIVLGYGATRRRNPFRRHARSPLYSVQVFAFADTTTYGVGDLVAEFEHVKNVGWADFENDVPQAFFTINQDDPKIKLLRNYKGKSHVWLWRGVDLVWTGWMALEIDANGNDAIFYCYGYAAGLFWSATDWNKEWTDATLKTIVSDSWTRAKTTLTHSRLGFVTTGTIEAPVTTAGGSTAITLPLYSAFYKRHLFLMQEMAALGASDTGHNTMFEITHGKTPTFNFWSDRSTDLTGTLKWEYGNGVVQDFAMYELPVYHRNDVLAVGSIPRDALSRTEQSDSDDITEWGRMQEPLFFAWVRDDTELGRVTKLRAAKALVTEQQPTLIFYPGAEAPPGAKDGRFRIGDKVPVKIDRGITHIDTLMQVTGVQVVAINNQEYLRVRIQEPI